MARPCLTGLPDTRDQPVLDSLRIGIVARQFSSYELFLDEDSQHEHPNGKARQHSSGVRFQPQRHADEQGDRACLHRMAYHAVDSAIDHRVMPCFLMLHHRRREGILLESEGHDPPTRDKERESQE
jgi:hypothetical protein